MDFEGVCHTRSCPDIQAFKSQLCSLRGPRMTGSLVQLGYQSYA